MKKIFSLLLVVVLLTGAVSLCVFAASASASLTGPDTVRAGDSITLTFKLNGSGILGASGSLSFESNQVSLTGTSQKIASPWMVEFNGNEFVAYDNNLTNPINSNTSIFTATFKVSSSLAVGTKVTISVKNIVTTDGTADTNVSDVSYSFTVAAPKSTDNTLKSLTVSNATINPAFDPNVTNYTASVPYEVSKLNLSYVTNHDKATVKVDNPTLTVNGTTKVTIKVTSESGSTKTYTITVARAQDPNYQPSSNNDLSGITVDGFKLSPVFTAENTQYIVWLPYETESVSVRGTAADSKASVRVEGGNNLLAGQDNEIRVICTAENGEQKVYYVIAKRAAAHNGEVTPPQPEVYTVFWVVDGVVTSERYETGQMPSFKGNTEKPADDFFTYSFTGWSQEISAVIGDVTYVAQYAKTPVGEDVYYTVFWVVDGRITVETYKAGEVAAFHGETAKEADAYYTYTFVGWDHEPGSVNGDAVYVAVYEKTAKQTPPEQDPQPMQPGSGQQEATEGVSTGVAILLIVLSLGVGAGGMFLLTKKQK